MYMVTGRSGFFGQVLTERLLNQNKKVRIFDKIGSKIDHPNLEVIIGDVRDKEKLNEIFDDVKIVYHNIAQVPIAKNKNLFWSVNYEGTENILNASLKKKIKHLVFISSSAVYGIPERNPIKEDSKKYPLEEYGKAKLAAEELCKKFINEGLTCSIIRPRTILGPGRLGIFQILFEWIYLNLNIPVIDKGNNIFQFIHANDLADVCMKVGTKEVSMDYNVGANIYGSMRENLENLINNVGSKSKIKSVSSSFANISMNFTSYFGLSPLAKYHALMYGNSMYFDTSLAQKELNFNPIYSNDEMLLESFKWYQLNREKIIHKSTQGSKHQNALRQGILRVAPYLI